MGLVRVYERNMLRIATVTRKLADRLIKHHMGGYARPAFYDVDETYPQLRAVDENFDVIDEELSRILPRLGDAPEYHDVDPSQAPVSAADDLAWRVFFIYMLKSKGIPNEGICPRTYEIVSRIPGAVNAFFSILEPHKNIPPHCGPFFATLRYHTAFRVPKDDPPTLRVKKLDYVWKERESLLWDDSHVHEVFNNSDETRIVLIVDVFRPLPWWLDSFNRVIGAITRQGIPDDKWAAAIERRSLKNASPA